MHVTPGGHMRKEISVHPLASHSKCWAIKENIPKTPQSETYCCHYISASIVVSRTLSQIHADSYGPTQHSSPRAPYSVTTSWQFEVSHAESIYTTVIGNCYTSRLITSSATQRVTSPAHLCTRCLYLSEIILNLLKNVHGYFFLICSHKMT